MDNGMINMTPANGLPMIEPLDRSRFKTAAFDLDGTLLKDGVLSETNRDALCTLHERGVEVVVSTGRHYKMMPEAIRSLPFIRYAITSGGSHVLDWIDNLDIAYTTFEKSMLIRLAGYLLEHARVNHVFSKEKIVVSWKDVWIMSKKVDRKSVKNERRDIFEWAKIVGSQMRYIKKPRITIGKLNAFFEDIPSCSAVIDWITKEFAIEAVSSTGWDIEITPGGVSKASGLTSLCNFLGLDVKDTVIFGDSANDKSIMQRGGYAVAMGNASEDVKAIADYVAPSVDEDGAAQAMLALFA